ncbi:PAS domain S-box protein, partial [Bacteroidota bacterium]
MNFQNRSKNDIIRELLDLQRNYELLLKEAKNNSVPEDDAEVSKQEDSEFRNLFDNAADSIFIAEAETGIILDANLKASQVLKLPLEEIIGLHQSRLHPPEKASFSKATFKQNIKEVGKEAYSSAIENILLCADGSTINVEVRASRIEYKGKDCLMGIFRDISKRKKTEQRLAENEVNLKAILENSLDSIWSINRAYEIQYINKVFQTEFKESFGVELTSGMNILDALPDNMRELWKSRYDRAFGGEHFVFKDEIPLENFTIYIEVSMQPVELNNQVVGASFYGRNITESKVAELSLIDSEERFRTLSSMTTEGIMIHDNGVVVDANQAFALIMGYGNPEEIIGKNGYKLVQFAPDSLKLINKRTTNRNSDPYEVELINKRGEKIYAETQGRDLIYRGKKTRLVYMRDISERKKAEEEIKRIEAMRSKFVANIGDVITIIDKNNSIQYASPNILRLFGWKSEEVLGMSFYDFVFEKSRNEVALFFEELRSEYCASGKIEFQYKGKDNVFRWIEFTGSNLTEDPDINGILGNYNEITERKRNEKELIIAKEKAEESDRLKSAFLANMSHEIRTPMNGILGFAELLRSKDLSSIERKEFIEIIQTSGERMLNIINDLINISKIEAQQVELLYSETNINEQFEYLVKFFDSEARQKSLTLKTVKQLPDNEAIINTDREKLYAILINLIKNAIKFTNLGSIEFGYSLSNLEVEFYVKDSGIGIKQEEIKTIFERFVQADSSISSGYEGAGLGLS